MRSKSHIASPSVRFIFGFHDTPAPNTWPPSSQTSPNRFSMEERESLTAFLLDTSLGQPCCLHCSCRNVLLPSSGLLACDWAEDPGWEDNVKTLSYQASLPHPQPRSSESCDLISPLWLNILPSWGSRGITNLLVLNIFLEPNSMYSSKRQ